MKRPNHLFVKTHTEFPPQLGLMSIRDILTKNKASLQKAEATPRLLTEHGPCKQEHSLLTSSLSQVTHFDLHHTQAFSLLVLARGHLPFRRAPRDHKLSALPDLLSTRKAWCSIWKVLPAAAALLAHAALPCWDSKPSRCRQELKVPLDSYRPLLFLLLTSCVCPSLYWVSWNLGPRIPQFITFPCNSFC